MWRFSPERLESVRTRRVLAFLLDYAIVGLLVVLAGVVVFFLGILTLGLGWLLYPVLALLIAVLYVGTTMGGPRQATWGMDFFSLRIERADGRPVDFITAVVHGMIFWVAHVTLTPLLLLVSLFTERKQLVQDILLGTVIVRSDR
ncbi:MAG: RDD family protein [Nitratireductor sp.]|nr:RDD family protein [Nitratireductor sp.]MCB1459331.1 RDD family protein [Nitratireductor sp.]